MVNFANIFTYHTLKIISRQLGIYVCIGIINNKALPTFSETSKHFKLLEGISLFAILQEKSILWMSTRSRFIMFRFTRLVPNKLTQKLIMMIMKKSLSVFKIFGLGALSWGAYIFYGARTIDRKTTDRKQKLGQ